MSNLSYLEALTGVVEPDYMEAMLGLVDNYKNWGVQVAKVPAHVIVALVEEVKRLREEAGGYKTIPGDD